MSSINTATLNSNELSEELDDASLQAITGGFLGSGSLAGAGSQTSNGGAFVPTPFGPAGIYGTQGSSVSGAATGFLSSILP